VFDGQANFALMKLTDITLSPAEGSEDQSTGKINSIELVNPSPETAAWVASLLGKGGSGSDDGIEQARIQRDAAESALKEANREGELLSGAAKLDHNKKTLELVGALADANDDYEMAKAGIGPYSEGSNVISNLSFDRFTINGVSISMADASGTGLFTIDSMHVSDLKEEKAGLMGLSNLKFDFTEAAGSDVRISLDGFGIKGINYALLSDAVAAGAGAAADPSALASAIQADPANPGYDAVVLKALKADIVGASVDMPGLESSVSRDAQGRATKVTTNPFTLTVASRDNPDGEQFAAALATMGYETLTFSGQGESLYDPDADLVTLVKGKNYWKLNEGFKLDVSAKYAGTKAIAAAQVASLDDTADPEAMLNAVMENVVVHGIEISLDDDGILDRSINAYAAQSGEDPAALRSQLSGMFAMAPMFAAGTGIDPAIVTELATALSSFVTEPKVLTISLAPKAPIKAQAFVDAASDPAKALTKETLGFSAGNK
jgi:hypothetical protein